MSQPPEPPSPTERDSAPAERDPAPPERDTAPVSFTPRRGGQAQDEGAQQQ
jgi:hypothetical protein